MDTVPLHAPERPRAAPAARRGAERGFSWAVIAAPAALAAVLTIVGITGRSLSFDEAATFSIASQHGAALWAAIAHDGGNMALYYLVVHALLGVFGSSLLVLRLPSALAAVAMVALVAAIGQRMFDRRAGLAAGLLAAVSLPLVYWSQTARAYAPMLAFLCGGFLAFLSLADPVPGRRSDRRAWLAYVACMTLACYCSFVAVLVVPVQVAALARRPAALRRLATALGAVAILCLPLVVLAVHRGSGQLFWVTRPSSMVDTQVLESITSAGLEATFRRTATTNLLIVITLVTMGLELLGVLWGLWRRAAAWPLGVTLGWFAFPVVATFVYSLFAHPIYDPRNVIMSVPAAAVALGLGLSDRRVPPVLAAILLTALLALRGEQIVAAAGAQPEPWHQVTADVLVHARPGDCIAFYPEDGRAAFQYYVARAGPAAARRAPRSILPSLPWGVVTPRVENYAYLTPAAVRTAAQSGCRRMWYVSSHEGESYGPPQARQHRMRWLALDAELRHEFGAGPMRRFGYASAVHVQLLSGRRAGARSGP